MTGVEVETRPAEPVAAKAVLEIDDTVLRRAAEYLAAERRYSELRREQNAEYEAACGDSDRVKELGVLRSGYWHLKHTLAKGIGELVVEALVRNKLIGY